MTDLIHPNEFAPIASLQEAFALDDALTAAVAVEMRRSPHLLAYLKKLHLIALAEVGKIKVIGADESDIKARLSRALTRVEVLESIITIPQTVAVATN